MPLCTDDLRYIVEKQIPYFKLYKHFSDAYNATENHPQIWYNKYVRIENSDLCDEPTNIEIGMAAESSPTHRR